MKRDVGWLLLVLTFLWGTTACNPPKAVEKIQQDAANVSDFEGNLSFNNVTLEQADEQGRPLWNVKAKKAVYSKDKKIARIEFPVGDLYQNGQLVLKVKAKQGEIQEDGKLVFLRGEIVATDPRNGMTLKGTELEWRSQENILVARNQLVGTHQKMTATAKEGKYYSTNQQLELIGKVEGTSQDPDLRIRTERLFWLIPQSLLTTDQRIQIDRYLQKKVTETAIANASQVNIKTQVATLQKKVQMVSANPPLQLEGEALVWNIKNKLVVANQPVTIYHKQQQVLAKGQQGQMDLQRNIAILGKGARGIGLKNQSELIGQQVTWYISNEQFIAEGNVRYRQTDPPLNLNGTKAVGRLRDQTVVVTGNPGDRVVTEIIP